MDVIISHYERLGEASEFERIPDGVRIIKAPEFWKQGEKGMGVKIAILDTGCDINHPDLKDRIVGVKNFTKDDGGNSENVTDYEGHGTHVAGIIAANENKDGVVGVAPMADLLILKVLSKNGGNFRDITKAVEYAIDQKADIISISFGGSQDYKPLHKAIKKAIENNILVVCASGNNGDDRSSTIETNYPAAYNECISVGSLSEGKKASKFSASNNEIDLLAPGQGYDNKGILSTMPGGKYGEMSGTSMAAPHVAGALALLINWSINKFERRLSEEELYAQLIKRTISLGYHKWIEGNGMLCLTLEEIIQKCINNSEVFKK